MPNSETDDRRVRRTRDALNQAFLDLVIERPYHEIQVAEIADRAGVGRSTFYEHFQNKDELLFASLAGVFEALADAASDGFDGARLSTWLDGLQTNRRLARILLSSQTRPYLSRHLASLIEQRLPRRGPPRSLSAAALGEAQLGLILAWLTGHVAASPADIADIVRRTTAGAVAGLYD